ncbi:hypothetical protein PRIC1_009547 [Phytophthora ramorum]|uniref:uncharacterized protein n=1 Tax=Phytophthora ramorum TaxID=164328 RepID=UPI003098C0BC|nr:hypothetical protein KRP23_5175 [Phytophthora ramorum]
MPKITKSGNKSPTLATATAQPDHLDSFMAEIDNLVIDERRVNLKPFSKSASPDILLVTKVHNKPLTVVGLVVKQCIRTEVKRTTVEDECDQFNRMFESKEGRLNVLVVCATVYSAELNKKFEAEDRPVSKSAIYPSGAFKQIDEVILLNLSTPENRAEFFGTQGEDTLRHVLESAIEKAPVQYINHV